MDEKHGLAKTLDQLVRSAEAQPGRAMRQPLNRGLRVDVMMKDGETHLQISRANIWPSTKEWNTVTRDFPSPVPNILPRRICAEGRYYLKAKWVTIKAEQGELIVAAQRIDNG